MNERLKEIRKWLGMTQTEFAADVKKTRDQIATYESGRVTPDDSFIAYIAMKYGFRESWIKSGDLPEREPEPDEDRIAEIGLRAAYLDEDAVRKRVHDLVDHLPAPQLKLLAAIWQSDEFRRLWDS